jgi:hypothetical protein
VGKRGQVKVIWQPVNLHDATEQARAVAWREQGQQRKIANAVMMWLLGFWNQAQAAKYCDPGLEKVARRYDQPPAVPSGGLERLGPAGDG